MCVAYTLVRLAIVHGGGLFPFVPSPQAATGLPAGFQDALVVSGLSNPTAMAFAPDGRLFVTQQGGQLRVIKNGVLLPTPFLTLTVNSAGERGLLGIAFDPNFAVNRFIYVYYTATTPAVHNRISRFRANGDVVDTSVGELVLLNFDNLSSATNHNGGALHFGVDGKLYAAHGDNANGSNAQSLNNLLGKIIRMNPVSDPTAQIPTDNPFFATASGKNRLIWTRGLRNPFTFSIQPGTGLTFVNDVGQGTFEEINDARSGRNLGWPTTEGPFNAASFLSSRIRYTPIDTAAGRRSGAPLLVERFTRRRLRRFRPLTSGSISSRTIARAGSTTSIPAAHRPRRSLLPASARRSTSNSAPTGASTTSQGERAASANRAERKRTSTDHATASQSHGGGRRDRDVHGAASGTAPLSYQWQKNGVDIPTATTASYTTLPTVLADTGSTYRCRVTNSAGSTTSNAATLTVLNNLAPTATIHTPGVGSKYSAGTTLSFSGSGTDPEDGTLAPAALRWRIDFHHETHTHPAMLETSGIASGTFAIPNSGEVSANVWYRVYLTATDSAGLSTTSFVDVTPNTAMITLSTVPDGLRVTLDGQPVIAPVTVTSVVGIVRTLGVVTPQTSGAVTYSFESWSDGGAATHTIATPGTNTTYRAVYTSPLAAPIGVQIIR